MFLLIVLLVIFLVIGVVEVFLTEQEKFGWATLTLLLTIGALQLFHIADIWTFVHEHAVLSLKLAGGVLGMGIAWSFAKWLMFLFAFRGEVLRVKANFLVSEKLPVDAELTPAQEKDLRAYLARSTPSAKLYRYGQFYPNSMDRIPQASENKARIIAWIGLWPFSMLGWLLNDPIARLINWSFAALKGTYQRVANFVFRDLKELK